MLIVPDQSGLSRRHDPLDGLLCSNLLVRKNKDTTEIAVCLHKQLGTVLAGHRVQETLPKVLDISRRTRKDARSDSLNDGNLDGGYGRLSSIRRQLETTLPLPRVPTNEVVQVFGKRDTDS